MTMATYLADGASPLGTDLRLSSRFLGEIIAGIQVLAVGGAAVGVLVAAAGLHKPQAPEPAYRSQFEAPIALTPPPAPAPAPAADEGYSKQMLQDLLTKAGLRPNYDLHRLNGNQARKVNAAMPAADPVPAAAQPFRLSVDTQDGRQALHCLTQAAYFEAGGNGPEAEAGVVQVVLNRVRHPDFPKSVCGVVYQGAKRATGCQFTFTCDGALKRALNAAAWNQARQVAMRALDGYVVPQVGSATFYHANYVFPSWAPALVKLATVGPHIFYRMTGPAGDAAALTGRYAGGELKVSRAILAAADNLTQKVRAHTSMALASAGKQEQERVHMQVVAAPAPAGDDVKLNGAQIIATPAPVLANAPAVAAPPRAPIAAATQASTPMAAAEPAPPAA
ncbi:MAG: cell wall hydrolase [Caulobacteraceae bacterium]|nr:cell wall hydrolase [Caulobacteraceae bacterium]